MVLAADGPPRASRIQTGSQAMVRPGWPDKGFSGIFEREFSGYDSRGRDLGLRTERPVPFQASGLAQPDKGLSGIFPESLWEFCRRACWL